MYWPIGPKPMRREVTAEAFACSIVGSRGDPSAQCFGLDLGRLVFAAGEFGS